MDSKSTIEDLKAAIKRLDEELREKEELRQAMIAVVEYFEGHGGERRSDGAPQSPPVRRQGGGELRNAIAEMLAQEGPLHRKQIHDRLVEIDMPIGGRDEMSTLAAHLSNDPRFRGIGNGFWRLVDESGMAEEEDKDSTEIQAHQESGLDDDDLDSGEEDSVPW